MEIPTRDVRILFVCSRNRLRSPTAEALYSSIPGLLAASAGTDLQAERRVSSELIDWADVVFAMESRHRKALSKAFPEPMKKKRAIVLGIRDDYAFMDPDLCSVLRQRVDGHLGFDSLAVARAGPALPRSPPKPTP